MFPDKELLDLFLFEDDVAGSVNRLFVYPFKNNEASYITYRLRDFYRRRGHLKVEIGEPKVESVGELYRVIVPIEEGARYRFGNIKFLGVDKAVISELRGIIGLERRPVVDGLALQNAVFNEIPEYFGARGHAFVSAEMENVKVIPPKEGEGEGTVEFEVVIDAGRKHRIKEVNVVGDADPSLVRTYLAFADGQMFRQPSIEESIKRLNDSGLFRDLDKYSVEVKEIEAQPEQVASSEDGKDVKLRVKKPAPRIGEISITIRVNKRTSVGSGTYHVRSVKFAGNKNISDSELTAAFGLEKGAYFDPKVFIQNVRRFNSTGRCKPIIEGDIEFGLGEEGDHDDAISGEMNLTIKIFEVRKD